MRAHQVNTVIEDDGIVSVQNVPVRAGERVQVIVLMPDALTTSTDRYPLRGRQPFRSDRPDEPVGEDDWEGGT
jgi:hypothetical protein